MKLKLFVLICFYFYIVKTENCKHVTFCGSESCSQWGHCFYDLKIYFNLKSTNKDAQLVSCVCDRGFVDDPDIPNIRCCYEQKSQFAAFLLESIIGFGAGHFFIGNYFVGIIKASLCCLICCVCLYIGFINYYKHLLDEEVAKPRQIFLNVGFIICICLYMTWQFVDILLFGMNIYKDKKNIALEGW